MLAQAGAKAHVQDVRDPNRLQKFRSRGVVIAPEPQKAWKNLSRKSAAFIARFVVFGKRVSTHRTRLSPLVLQSPASVEVCQRSSHNRRCWTDQAPRTSCQWPQIAQGSSRARFGIPWQHAVLLRDSVTPLAEARCNATAEHNQSARAAASVTLAGVGSQRSACEMLSSFAHRSTTCLTPSWEHS